MHVPTLTLCLAMIATALAWTPASTNETDLLAAQGLRKLAQLYAFGNITAHKYGNCSLASATVRKEWTSLKPQERKAYTDAVLCLQSKPSRLDPAVVPGAKNRYDDFVALHINQTLFIHLTANFLSWHRLFTWNYEKALQDECGYQGTQPYWNWGKARYTAFDPLGSPVFDGSEFSMSGNGIYDPHNCTDALPSHLNCIPPGSGGGCVQTGPFKNMSVNLGPVAPALRIAGLNASSSKFAYNPRCLRRDVSVWVSSNWTRDIDSSDLIKQNLDINSFQSVMQGFGTPPGYYGVHSGGHYTIGGDPGGDFYASPGDPAFFLHHAQIDRTWTIWQTQDFTTRRNAISGTMTLANTPPSRNGTLDDILDMGATGQSFNMRDAMSTLDGPFCYIYA
ncbi:hypothetical protein BP6252_06269 [Coleophoma cylindrospora]|uniref:Tyrosinase copper-binding domain-containing protein n=1 Tax=Coleophoma cylindrospora TaxID=1849047 RepID=A0A3D8RM42_9HELO|nr:hypothetical protein BP6252_06269 [Coleophoma cylindrospora]